MNARFVSFCQDHFPVVMVAALAIGLCVPFFGETPDYLPPVILAVMMGFSYSKITVSELKQINLREITIFYIFRFLLFPWILFGLCLIFLPGYKYAVLLLALLPAAVSAGAMASILGGNASLALTGTVVTSIVAPFMIPLAFGWVGMTVELDILGMFITLCAILFVPAIIYFGGVRHFRRPKKWVQDYAGFMSVILFSLFIVIVVSQLREEILSNLPLVFKSAGVLAVFFGSFYLLPWLLMRHRQEATRISYTIISGCNNMGLGVSLAMLYFPDREKLYIMVCEFLWVFLFSGLQYFLKWRKFHERV